MKHEQSQCFQNHHGKYSSCSGKKRQASTGGLNGIEGVGKTTFAIALVEFLNQEGLDAIHVSIDGYHHDKNHRYRQGRDSADGYYEDAYQEEAFVEHVLQASQGDSPRYVPVIHDLETDEHLPIEYVYLPPNAVLVTDV